MTVYRFLDGQVVTIIAASDKSCSIESNAPFEVREVGETLMLRFVH